MVAFIRKLRPKEVVKPEYFYVRIDRGWKVMERYDRAKSMR